MILLLGGRRFDDGIRHLFAVAFIGRRFGRHPAKTPGL